MKVGDYVRTKFGQIGKLEDINEYNIYIDLGKHILVIAKTEDYKSSPNIIDLVEINDFVNQEEVILVQEIRDFSTMEEYKEIVFRSGYKIRQEEIKSIVTKEAFESMEYRIGE